MNSLKHTSTTAKQHVVVQHYNTGTWKNKRHIALYDVFAAAELTEHDAQVTLESQKIWHTVDRRRRLGISKHNARCVKR